MFKIATAMFKVKTEFKNGKYNIILYQGKTRLATLGTSAIEPTRNQLRQYYNQWAKSKFKKL